MKIENVEVSGWGPAIRGMRNPLDSWHKSDSSATDGFIFGYKDLELACKLVAAGTEHRKFLRQIVIWVDFVLPRYIWTELDTYKIATVRNSCSTMHKLGSVDLTQEDFEQPISELILDILNSYGEQMREAKVNKDSKRIKEIRRGYKNLLPEGYLQRSTYMMNYETALSMYFQRRNHRLPEWNEKNENSICSFIKSLPYMEHFINAIGKK